MTVAVRLSNGMLIMPVRRGVKESIVESATVHAVNGYVVFDPGVTEFVIESAPATEKVKVFLRYERIAEVDELPSVIRSEDEMAHLRTQWQNVDAFYRRVDDVSISTSTTTRVITVDDLRIIEVDTDKIPASADGWTVVPDYLGLPAPLSAMVPGTLGGVPALVEARLDEKRVYTGYSKDGAVPFRIEFQIPFADARTKLVKKDPWNNRSNAKRIRVPDTKYVELHVQVPVKIAADALDAAHAEVDRIVAEIKAQLTEPVAVCATCAGDGLVLIPGIQEKRR